MHAGPLLGLQPTAKNGNAQGALRDQNQPVEGKKVQCNSRWRLESSRPPLPNSLFAENRIFLIMN